MAWRSIRFPLLLIPFPLAFSTPHSVPYAAPMNDVRSVSKLLLAAVGDSPDEIFLNKPYEHKYWQKLN